MKYGKVDLGQIESGINKLNGMRGWRELLDDGIIIKPVLGEVEVGTPGFTGSVLLRKVGTLHNVSFESKAREVLDTEAKSYSLVKKRLQLQAFQPRELGFYHSPSYGEMLSRAQEMGFHPCPPEVVLKLVRQKDVWLGCRVYIAMKLVTTENDSEGRILRISQPNLEENPGGSILIESVYPRNISTDDVFVSSVVRQVPLI